MHSPPPAGTNDVPIDGQSDNAGASAGIIDIRQALVELNLKENILANFKPESGARTMPTLLLYDQKGLQLFEKITYLDEYYLTNNEIRVLESSAAQIAQEFPNDVMIVELGSGNLRKVNILLQALDRAGKSADYYALDLSRPELERTLAHLPEYKSVRCHGLHGTYDDGKAWLQKPENKHKKKCVVSLGSSIGNFENDDAAAFLREFSEILGKDDVLLIGLDTTNDPKKIYHAYNDHEGVTHAFLLNGLTHANRVFGSQVFNESDWEVIGEYVYDRNGSRHQASYSPLKTVNVLGATVEPHEKIRVEQSVKYSHESAAKLWKAACLKEHKIWTTPEKDHGLWMLTTARQS